MNVGEGLAPSRGRPQGPPLHRIPPPRPLLAQGVLSSALIRKAVMEEFVRQ